MGGFIYPDGLRLWMMRRSFAKKIAEAKGWPMAQGEVNGWRIVQAETHAPFGLDSQIEAGFHFIVNGEYFGGYVRSEPMVRREAERLGQRTPKISIRYDPANPDKNFVLAVDNSANLPFEVYSGPRDS